jgi:hypothetical protein
MLPENNQRIAGCCDSTLKARAREAYRVSAFFRGIKMTRGRHHLIQVKPQAGLWKCTVNPFDQVGHSERATMAIQIVMDHTGDSRHSFNPNDALALAKAEMRFRELTGYGFTAAVRTASGEVSQVRSFDPTAEATLFFPRLVGG